MPFGAGGSYSGGVAGTSAADAALGRELNLIAIRTNSLANTTEVYLNGGVAIGSFSAPTSDGKFLEDTHVTNMMNNAGESPYWSFDLMIFDSSLSNADLDTVYSYLSKKHGVAVTAVS